MEIHKASESDFEGMWQIFKAVVRKGDTYVFSPDTGKEDAHAYWFCPGITSFVAVDNGRIVGMYKFLSNQRDLGLMLPMRLLWLIRMNTARASEN